VNRWARKVEQGKERDQAEGETHNASSQKLEGRKEGGEVEVSSVNNRATPKELKKT
jgi:hypothetical protein